MKFVKEFKDFINKGNVMDLAVGVIIGAAFTSIVDSLVKDIIMPVVSLFTSGTDFSAWYIQIRAGDDASRLNYGNFIYAIINFLIISIVVFIMVKGINELNITEKKEEEATTKVCPYCKTQININAVKCPNCTADLS